LQYNAVASYTHDKDATTSSRIDLHLRQHCVIKNIIIEVSLEEAAFIDLKEESRRSFRLKKI